MNGLYVIAGATGAIGKQICRNIVAKGGTPLLLGRSREALCKLNDEEFDGKCPILANIDFSRPDEAGEKVAAELKGEELSGLAYAVGSITLKPLRNASTQDFLDSFTLNLLGASELIKATHAGLKKGGTTEQPSSIVLFSTVAVRHGLANHAVIASTKGALEGMAMTLAAEFAPTIRVNCIAPSLVGHGSKMAASIVPNEKMVQAIAKVHPLPRLGDPRNVADAATFFLSRESNWTTGAILPVDGGRSSVLN